MLAVAVVVVTYLALLGGIGLLALGTFLPERPPDLETSGADDLRSSAPVST
jgi:hypothetical protein